MVIGLGLVIDSIGMVVLEVIFEIVDVPIVIDAGAFVLLVDNLFILFNLFNNN